MVESIESTEVNFEELKEKLGNKYPGAARIWEQNFTCVTQLFDYPAEIRKQIYTTNMIEILNSALRDVTDRKGASPNKDSLSKLLYLRIMSLVEKWSKPVRGWATIRDNSILFFPDGEQGVSESSGEE